MNRFPLSVLALCAVLGLPACKIVKTPAEGSAATSSGESGDDARIAALVDETLATRLLPLVSQSALSVSDLRTALGTGIDGAGKAYGHRGAGEGAAWNFAVKGLGTVIEANLKSRARKAQLDTDADGKADVTLQLGPVIKGTALRDIAPFYNFNDFRDQIEFAKLGRALNDRVSANLVVPGGDLAGTTVKFTGALDLRKADDAWLVTVTEITVAP